jgi:uncharacterized membrane-anchored protein YitT (DUF2179 family)
LQKAIFFTLGAFFQGLAMAVFLFPHFIPSGGVAGLAILGDYFFSMPHGLTLWAINFALLLIAVKKLGRQTALWTIYCVAVTSVTVDGLSIFIEQPIHSTWLDVFYGAVMFGIGVGLLFRFGASSGGMDILALILAKWTGKKPGRILFWINSLVLLLTAFTIGFEIILYALSCQWIATRLIDFIRTFHFSKSAKQYM